MTAPHSKQRLFSLCSRHFMGNVRSATAIENAMPPNTDTLAAIMGWWIEVRCGCGRTTQFPVKLLAREHGPAARPADLVARMRCERCRVPPVQAELIDNPQAGASGYVGSGQPQRLLIR